MEATLLATTPAMSLSSTSKTLNRHFSAARPSHLTHARLGPIFTTDVRSLNRFESVSLSGGLDAVDLRLHCLGSGGDGAAEGGESKPGAAEDVSALSSDVIILDVGGMLCGGCTASVKRILEGQPQVSSANVNLTTETAIVWPVSEAKVEPNWQKQLGEALANHLTTCGFKSKLKGQGANEGDTSS